MRTIHQDLKSNSLSLPKWSNRRDSESSTLETIIYVWRYTLLVVPARKEEEEEGIVVTAHTETTCEKSIHQLSSRVCCLLLPRVCFLAIIIALYGKIVKKDSITKCTVFVQALRAQQKTRLNCLFIKVLPLTSYKTINNLTVLDCHYSRWFRDSWASRNFLSCPVSVSCWYLWWILLGLSKSWVPAADNHCSLCVCYGLIDLHKVLRRKR